MCRRMNDCIVSGKTVQRFKNKRKGLAENRTGCLQFVILLTCMALPGRSEIVEKARWQGRVRTNPPSYLPYEQLTVFLSHETPSLSIHWNGRARELPFRIPAREYVCSCLGIRACGQYFIIRSFSLIEDRCFWLNLTFLDSLGTFDAVKEKSFNLSEKSRRVSSGLLMYNRL